MKVSTAVSSNILYISIIYMNIICKIPKKEVDVYVKGTDRDKKKRL